MSLCEVAVSTWTGAVAAGDQTEPLEAGNILFCRDLRFDVNLDETHLFSPDILGRAKNASFDPATERLGGTTLTGSEAATLAAMMRRFSEAAAGLVDGVCPHYRGRVVRGRASFRPAEIAGRASSWRKDDTRLHVDSFPATPTGGRRILRVFSNVNPDGRARTWRVGDAFESVARRFARQLKLPLPGAGYALALLRITKSPRTPYDALMLQLHDAMKMDEEFQSSSPQSRVDFPSGSNWLCFTDQVSHAAMAGQYQLEQTFLLPVDAMKNPERSPLRILERLKQRRLS